MEGIWISISLSPQKRIDYSHYASTFENYELGRSLHSTRHCFRDALRLIDAPDWVVQGLGGWQQNTGASEGYGSTKWPDKLAEKIEAIEYEGLVLPDFGTP